MDVNLKGILYNLKRREEKETGKKGKKGERERGRKGGHQEKDIFQTSDEVPDFKSQHISHLLKVLDAWQTYLPGASWKVNRALTHCCSSILDDFSKGILSMGSFSYSSMAPQPILEGPTATAPAVSKLLLLFRSCVSLCSVRATDDG